MLAIDEKIRVLVPNREDVCGLGNLFPGDLGCGGEPRPRCSAGALHFCDDRV